MQGLVTSVGGRMDLVTVYVTENCWVNWTGESDWSAERRSTEQSLQWKE